MSTTSLRFLSDDVRLRVSREWYMPYSHSRGEFRTFIRIEKFIPRHTVPRRWRKPLLVEAEWVTIEWHMFEWGIPTSYEIELHTKRLHRNYELRRKTEKWLQDETSLG